MDNLIGAHCFTAGGIETALETAKKLNIKVIQIFTKNNNQWEAKDLNIELHNFFNKHANKAYITYAVAHSSYLINLGTPKAALLQKSLTALKNELNRCQFLGISDLVLHPGSYKDSDFNTSILQISQSIDKIYDENPDLTTKILLENTAGQGSSIGHTFHQLKQIFDLIHNKNKIGFCLDTAHMWAAGYDFVNNYEKVIEEFDNLLGISNLKLIHLNDSKSKFNSRVDRHEHIGKGTIGLKGFENILNDKRLKHIPKVIETPKSKTQIEDIENFKILYSLIKT